MKIKLLTVLLMAILIVTGFSGCIEEEPGPEVREYFEDEYSVNDDTILNIITVNGAIYVTTWDNENIFLNATKRSRYGQDDLDKAEIRVTEDNNEITIEIKHDLPIRSRAVDLDIKIPNNATLKSATSTNGPIEISNTYGDSILKTTNGPISAEGIDGYIKASTTNGGIEVKDTTGVDDLISTNGGISAEIFDIRENIDILTTNGGITVYINPNINASIEIETVNGDISGNTSFISITESTFNSLKGTIGAGGDKIDIETTNGGIKLYKLEM